MSAHHNNFARAKLRLEIALERLDSFAKGERVFSHSQVSGWNEVTSRKKTREERVVRTLSKYLSSAI